MLYTKVMKEVRYIRTSEDREKILKACHMDPTSGHMGVKRTTHRITERYFWKGVTKDVEFMVCIHACVKLYQVPVCM